MSYKNEIDTVVFPVAGIGSRFLPATKSVPKELLPILNRPLIEYAFEEAMQSGIEKFIFINSPEKQSITSHFKTNKKLEEILKIKSEFLYSLISKYIIPKEKIVEVVQSEPMGLGHAIWCARDYIDNKAFAVILPDDLILGNNSIISEMSKVYTQKKSSVIAIKKVPSILLPNLGVVDAKRIESKVYEILNMVEKPKIEDAPSDLAIIGRYILHYEIFETLEKTNLGINGEIQLTDAIDSLIKDIGVLGYQFPEVHFDVGTPLGLLKASIHQSMKNEEFIDDIKSFFKF